MRNTKSIRASVAAFLALSLLLMAGCDILSRTPDVTESPNATSPEATETPTQAPEVDGKESLDALRLKLEEEELAFAVAYLGDSSVLDTEDYVDVQEMLDITAPQLCEEMPFLRTIPKERVVGDARGQLYCIVPRDSTATVTVSLALFNGGDYEEPLYEAQSGEPILLFCNYIGWGADSEVIITDSDGYTYTWHPMLDMMEYVDQLYVDNEAQILDFSPYYEILALRHAQILSAGEGWVVPTAQDLLDTSWEWEGDLSEECHVKYQVTFNDEALLVSFTDGYEDVIHDYDAPWSLTEVDGYAVLEADFGEFAGEVRYNLLYNEEYEMLYVMRNVTTGTVERGWENLFRYMQQTSYGAPSPVEMVGTWERYATEIEGDFNASPSGACTVVISGTTEDDLKISYTNKDFPDNNYKNKALSITEGTIYSGIGNDLWYADVDYVGSYDTTYCVMLLGGGTLLLRNYFLLDGAPTVSFEWFQRAT